MSLEQVSSNKAFGGDLIKYKFKVGLPEKGSESMETRLTGFTVGSSGRPERQLQPLPPRQRC